MTGILLALGAVGKVEDAHDLWDVMALITLFVIGLAIAVYGLFEGIEAAVANGTSSTA